MKLLKRDVGSVYMGLQDDLADVFGMSGEAETLFGEEEQEQLELLFNVVQHAHTSLAAHDACMTAHALATASAARFKDAISAAVKASNASGGSSQEEVDALATRVRDLAGTAETAKATVCTIVCVDSWCLTATNSPHATGNTGQSNPARVFYCTRARDTARKWSRHCLHNHCQCTSNV